MKSNSLPYHTLGIFYLQFFCVEPNFPTSTSTKTQPTMKQPLVEHYWHVYHAVTPSTNAAFVVNVANWSQRENTNLVCSMDWAVDNRVQTAKKRRKRKQKFHPPNFLLILEMNCINSLGSVCISSASHLVCLSFTECAVCTGYCYCRWTNFPMHIFHWTTSSS